MYYMYVSYKSIAVLLIDELYFMIADIIFISLSHCTCRSEKYNLVQFVQKEKIQHTIYYISDTDMDRSIACNAAG